LGGTAGGKLTYQIGYIADGMRHLVKVNTIDVKKKVKKVTIQKVN
jgi:hypothetical protein